MTNKSNKGLSLVSLLLSGTSITLDVYNEFVYRSKHRKLSYISIAIGLIDVALDTYLAFKSKSKLVRTWSLISLGRQIVSSVQKIKFLQSR
ncbi:hypothetical protein [Staphylococcus canis]|uniref:Holin n=1 Tax=Staphylococcus canis TaxID=2724942 RepID=A0ABS0T8H4_9STAP|nr:hypothetical protein [Staphylococcus canis]MBI5975016.1 hypothetical protein [Staphylococcus canis]